MRDVVLRTVIECPVCGFRTTEKMPRKEKRRSYTCPACGHTSSVTAQQCCVFCAWARHPCPEKQQSQA